MFKKKEIKGKELHVPPIALTEIDSKEVLRMWAKSGHAQQLTINTTWSDPGAWGLALVDIARHVALAYSKEGKAVNEVLDRIKTMFMAEWESPTDNPSDISDK